MLEAVGLWRGAAPPHDLVLRGAVARVGGEARVAGRVVRLASVLGRVGAASGNDFARVAQARGALLCADDREGVVDAQVHAGVHQNAGRSLVRAVDVFRRHARQCRQPLAYVVAVRIVALGLLPQVVHKAERVRVQQASRHVLKAQGVALHIRVQQRVPEVLQAPLPRQEQVLHEEAGADHAQPVVHPAGAPQLQHARVHQRVARRPLSPGLEQRLVKIPRAGPQVLQQGALVGEWEVEAEVAPVLPVAHLAEEVHARGRSLPRTGPLPLPLLHQVVDPPDAHFSKVDVGREPGRRVAVGLGAVTGKCSQPLLQKVVQYDHPASSARCPLELEMLIRHLLFFCHHFQVIKLQRLNRRGHGGHPMRREEWKLWRMWHGGRLFPEFCKRSKRRIALAHHLPGLVEKLAIEAEAGHVVGDQLRLHLVVAHQRDGIIQVIVEHRGGTRLLGEAQQRRSGLRAALEDQARAQLGQVAPQGVKRGLQPPSGALSWLELALLLWGEYVHRNHVPGAA
mmetsp:Transcript_44136/g.110824  ORF Transcript_44136/g.110824 Transcript_44136/m.110824 type:complete len:510 (-) Transcript_44136:515-2044(-)